MDLVYSIALIGLAVILFNVFLLGDRMPDKPGWASEGVISDLWCVTITGLIAFGTAYGVQFVLTMSEQPFGLKEAALVAAVLSACYVVVRLTAPFGRLALGGGKHAQDNGASESSPAYVIEPTSPSGDNHAPSKADLPKAA